MSGNEIAEFLRQIRAQHGTNAGFHEFCGPKIDMAVADRSIDELEQRINEKYIQYCDPKIPLHVMARVAANFAINKIRYNLHSAGYILGNGPSLPQSEKDYLFKLCVESVEEQNRLKGHPGIKKYFWFTNFHKPFVPLIHLAFNLRFNPAGDIADRAWEAIGKVMVDFLQHRSTYARNRKTFTDTPLYIAFANLISKAWDAREQALRQAAPIPVPIYVAEMKEKLASRRNTPTAQPALPDVDFGGQNIGTFDQTLFNDDFNSLTAGGNMDQMWLASMTNSMPLTDTDPANLWNTFAPAQVMMQNFAWDRPGPYVMQ